MYTLIILMKLINVSYSETIEYKNGNFNFHLEIGTELIKYTSINSKLTLVRKKCNEDLLSKLNFEFKKSLKNELFEKGNEFLTHLNLNGKKYFIPKRGKLNSFLEDFILKLKKAKIAEYYNCK